MINFKIPLKIRFLLDFNVIFTNYQEEIKYHHVLIYIMFKSDLRTGKINEISFGEKKYSSFRGKQKRVKNCTKNHFLIFFYT